MENKSFLYLTGKTRIIVSEWVPFGENNIISLSKKLETETSRDAPSILTEVIDPEPREMLFETDSIPTIIHVLNSSEGQFVEFRCTVSYEETNADIQEEHFGVHVDSLGRIFYGFDIIEAGGMRERYSVDAISAILADIVHDSSRMLNTIVSKYHKRLLELIYFNEPLQRDKFFLIFSEGIDPKMSKDALLGFTSGILELKQVLGAIQKIVTLKDGTLLILGTNGVIAIGEKSFNYEETLTTFAFLKSIENALDNSLARMWRSWDASEELKEKVFAPQKGTPPLRELSREISELQSDVSIIRSIFKYLRETIGRMRELVASKTFGELGELLDINGILDVLDRRVEDAIPVAEALSREVDSLANAGNTLLDASISNVMDAVRENTRRYVAIGEALELLEVGIFGVYIVELLHILFQYSGIEGELLNLHILGLPITFWLIITIGIGGVFFGWYLMKWTKRRILQE
jgi:hypothetical protein